MCFLVTHVKERLQSELVSKLYKVSWYLLCLKAKRRNLNFNTEKMKTFVLVQVAMINGEMQDTFKYWVIQKTSQTRA